MEDLHEEKYIKKSISPINIKGTEAILDQMKNYICKIYKGGTVGTGFFCKIPFPDKFNLLKVLITNRHVLNEKEIKTKKEIKFSLNDENIQKSIKIDDDTRKVFSSKNFDVTFIEIIEEKDEIDNFLDIDEKIFKIEKYKQDFYNDIYSNNSIYILNYPEGKNIVVSYGSLKEINKTYIHHDASTKEGSSGSPILSLNNFGVIGIHCGSSDKFNFNKGIFITYPINEFFKEMKKKIIEIDIKITNKIIFGEVNTKINKQDKKIQGNNNNEGEENKKDESKNIYKNNVIGKTMDIKKGIFEKKNDNLEDNNNIKEMKDNIDNKGKEIKENNDEPKYNNINENKINFEENKVNKENKVNNNDFDNKVKEDQENKNKDNQINNNINNNKNDEINIINENQNQS